MPNFNYLPNSKSGFPHIGNVDTYKYDNDFDYGRFNYDQMSLTVCSVPWDMGEAHVGNRTISGIGNVVYFGSKEERDAWFAAIPDSECYRFTTKFKELHRDGFIDVPIPYDMCAKHNYLVVHYEKFANEDSPVMYEGDDGLRDWFWFIREVEFLAANTTRLHIMDDAFQTWIYDVDITGMILERGHAPMFAMRTDEYLNNPIENNAYLLTEDVNFGEASIVKHIDALALNAGSTMYACIATTALPTANWGTKAAGTWNTPAPSYANQQGAPSVFVFAVTVGSLNTFLANVDAYVPQFKQTVQGVFFASSDLITTNGTFTFADTTCYYVRAGRTTLDLIDLDKTQFGYASDYADIAKLYTSPYAYISVTDENGREDIIRIEDTGGSLDVNAALSLAYPFVNIDAHLLGVGGSATKTIAFRNLDTHFFTASGRWFDTVRSWGVPVFAVVQESEVNYDYATHFNRAQRVVDYQTAYDNAIASAAANKGNADDSASAITDNADTTTSANTSKTARSNVSAFADAGLQQTYNTNVADFDSVLCNASASSTIAAADQQATISIAAGAASSALNVAGSVASLDASGVVSNLAGGFIGGETILASTAVSNHATSVAATATGVANRGHANYSNSLTENKAQNQTDTATDITDIDNDTIDAIAATNAATLMGNAARTQGAENANAARTQAQAQSAIANDLAQAALNAPLQFGTFTGGDTATTKPIALFAHVITQSKSAIESAGDEFLRYGYALDKQWQFDGEWNIGRYFTYWKLRDFWVSNLNVPDLYMDKLRFFLFGGVTVWRDPDDIGRVTIYDNFTTEGA